MKTQIDSKNLWFENRCKNDMTQEEGNNLKNNINNFI